MVNGELDIRNGLDDKSSIGPSLTKWIPLIGGPLLALGTIIRLSGNTPLLLLGFMLATAFFSKWISNTATTMTTVPIALGAIARLEATDRAGSQRFVVVLLLGIACAASMGGIATLIGTPPSLALNFVGALVVTGAVFLLGGLLFEG